MEEHLRQKRRKGKVKGKQAGENIILTYLWRSRDC